MAQEKDTRIDQIFEMVSNIKNELKRSEEKEKYAWRAALFITVGTFTLGFVATFIAYFGAKIPFTDFLFLLFFLIDGGIFIVWGALYWNRSGY